MKFSKIRHIHFTGIGGIGMSGIAEILLNQGFAVSGSDLALSEVTERLSALGARITQGHDPERLRGADVLVYSSAVAQDNPEILAARDLGIPVIRRAEMLAEVMRLHYGIAVAGTHGKTTVTSMLGVILIHGGYDPTVIVGGKLHAFGGSNARLGKGEFMVVEADEFDRSFLQLSPAIAVLTTLEEEHLDIYANLDDLQRAFTDFANKVPFYGFVALCLDEAALQEIRPRIDRTVISYGCTSQCDLQAADIAQEGSETSFTVLRDGVELGRVRLGVPGRHNVRNALAAILVALELGMPFEAVREALGAFRGAYRRFEVKGEPRGIMVVDDYAHHPTEVRETLFGIRAGWKRRVICVFQPHTFTRTRDFAREFGRAFMHADVLLVTEVYPAREQPIQGVSGRLIVEAARSFGHRDARFVPDAADVPALLAAIAQPGDIVITMGAGDIYRSGAAFLAMLERPAA
jgi:UDP-N-acetylmuramate--alanine ligase